MSVFGSPELAQSDRAPASVVRMMSTALRAASEKNPAGEGALGSLLGCIAQRDEVAFARLYELTSPRVFGLVLRILGDRDAAAELNV